METQATLSTALQICPTRIDNHPVLFAHRVSPGQCQDRQRGHYHKCFTCVHNNAYVSRRGVPVEAPKLALAKKERVG